MYFQKNTSIVPCGRCFKNIPPNQMCAKVYRGGCYGQGKSFHILCAILEYKEYIATCEHQFNESGRRGKQKVSC